MAKPEVDGDVFDSFDTFDDNLNFENSLNFDDEPIFDNSWVFQDTPPYDEGLYSTPLSWEAPQVGLFKQESAGPIYTAPMTNSLSAAQQEQLRNIAMPLFNSQHSPDSMSSTYKSGSVSSPENKTGRKRKSSEDEDDDDDGEEGKHPPVKKTAHNMIEKRYRTNLNDKIAALRDSVPSLRVMSKSARGGQGAKEKEDLDGLTPAHKLNKATVLAKATEYIRHLEKRNTRLLDENKAMKARIAAFEKLFLSGSMGVQPMPRPGAFTYQAPYIASQGNNQPAQDVSPEGMISVPDDFRRLHAQNSVNQQTYQVPQEDFAPVHNGNGWNGGGYYGKMMVGTLAGLMIMEGFVQEEQSGEEPNQRGLFSAPVGLLRELARYMKSSAEFNMLGYHYTAAETLANLKILLMFGALAWVFVPSFFTKRPNTKSMKSGHQKLAAAPPPASPIAVRRQAWLTAAQTVWVPRHNFVLEATALCLKMFKMSIRNAIGCYGYSIITGTTDQEEAARVKGWSIALDAQLAGGDVEVSKARLILTLIASGTLPDTPARLMLKAVHVRIMLMEFGNAGLNGFYLFKELAGKLSRWKWNEAKQLQQILNNSPVESRDPDFEPLPDHLAALLEQDFDNVLIDSIAQRAYNLAWNLPTTHSATGTTDGMDSVVDDRAVRSPLDAVAAWWSTVILQQALAESLSQKVDKHIADIADKSSEELLNLAIKTAPIGSGAQLRALVARAVLSDSKRGEHITSVVEILTPLSMRDNDETAMPALVNTSTSTLSHPDLRMSLNCAIAIGHLKRSPSSTPAAVLKILHDIRPAKLTLLGFTAAYNLLQALFELEGARSVFARPLENLAGTLRIWIGGEAGAKSGLGKETKEVIVERCIGITKKLIGMEEDTGYESMSE